MFGGRHTTYEFRSLFGRRDSGTTHAGDAGKTEAMHLLLFLAWDAATSAAPPLRLRNATAQADVRHEHQHGLLCTVHRRQAYQANSSQDLLPDIGNCSCQNAAIEAGKGNDAFWNWQQLSNVGFLKLQISRHVLMFWSGNLLTGVTDIFFSMPHKVMGFFGHPSLLELLRRRAFYEDTEAVVCSNQEDCRAKRVLTIVEWLLVARNSLLQHGILSTWELASDEQSIVVNDFRRHTLVVESIFADLTRDSEDATWGPSVKLLLQLIKEELSVDFGQTFRVTSPWCNSSIRSIRDGEPARLFVDLEVSWFSKLCYLSLESPDQTFEASEGTGEDAEPGKQHSCGFDISPKPLQSGGLLLHVLGHAVVSPMHGITSTKSAEEVEVLLFAHGLDSCIPVMTESKARHVLSQPHVALFPWRCSFDGFAGQPVEAVPVSMMGFTLTVVCPVPAQLQPSLLRLVAEPQNIELPVPISPNCPEKPRHRLAVCLRIHYDLIGLVAESGYPKFVIYDEDGSFGRLDSGMSMHPRVTYFLNWPAETFPELAADLQGQRDNPLAAQADAHCLMMLKGQVDWVAMMPGFDTFLWTPASSQHSDALKPVLLSLEPHRRNRLRPCS
ncbi:mycE [Symbiodinium sp. CCMP2592]|nr:mycE [Symbiodinium sp. CCMP2592]